ncbi:MAG: dihydrofolate reductase [Alistipes sp.]|nr:dihydrofolate reductase [Alistipes sp.]
MITIIVAVAANGVIGDKNALLWHIREDMVRFRTITSGHPVIMGRKTYESIGRPLPKRTNVVITRSDLQIEGCRVVHSLDEAFEMFEPSEEVFVIGGAQIYEQALSKADRILLTIVHRPYEGDTSFPTIDPSVWEECSRERFERGEEFDAPFSFVEFRRR